METCRLLIVSYEPKLFLDAGIEPAPAMMATTELLR
jgi:hypothetical protein